MSEERWVKQCPNCGKDIYSFNNITNHPELHLCTECWNAYTIDELNKVSK